MPFVKLDCAIVDSTLWTDRDSREVFITALLMARPHEFTEPTPQIAVRAIEHTGFIAQPAWYGFVEAAGPGIVRRAGLPPEDGMNALERLGAPDPSSRSGAHEGRRMIRIDGGYLILNYMAYRDKDYTASDRMRRLRDRRRGVTRNTVDVTRKSDVADAYADAYQTKRVAALPDWLDKPAWEAWTKYRAECRKPLKPSTLSRQLRFLGEHLPDHAAIIEQSIRNGWTGLFEFKDNANEKSRRLSSRERVIAANDKRDAEDAKLIPLK